MKKITLILIFHLLIVAVASAQRTSPLETVEKVDLSKYKGTWYEIARYPNKFQKKCVGNTTATYNLNENGTVEVVNECLLKNGKTEKAIGKARVIDKNTNAKLEVRFAPAFLSFLSAVWGDYWIIDLEKDYEYAAVGDPKREYFWILSRKPELDVATYQAILRRAETLGFNPSKVYKTPQNVEVLKGEVVQKK
jgi:apolipoprotein D and lipocalin family protein